LVCIKGGESGQKQEKNNTLRKSVIFKKVKGKADYETGHEDPEGDYR
jgi:hypothetical protein